MSYPIIVLERQPSVPNSKSSQDFSRHGQMNEWALMIVLDSRQLRGHIMQVTRTVNQRWHLDNSRNVVLSCDMYCGAVQVGSVTPYELKDLWARLRCILPLPRTLEWNSRDHVIMLIEKLRGASLIREDLPASPQSLMESLLSELEDARKETEERMRRGIVGVDRLSVRWHGGTQSWCCFM